ncbi:MAG TPA: hypothetical protein ENJ09_04390 [Planctomycetes bacterium]|nr:hypothetical protein [Planctomycetota bacterium]
MRTEARFERLSPNEAWAEGSELWLAEPPEGGTEELDGTAILVLPRGRSDAESCLERCAEAARSGAVVLVLGADDASDREAVARLDGAARWLIEHAHLAPRSLAVVGWGRGGTRAFLAACTSTRFGAAANLGGPVLYPELDAERPTQPLELSLNLDLPLLVIAPEESEETVLLRRTLADANKDAEVEVLADPGEPGTAWDEAAWQRTLRFLSERL